VIIVPLSLLFLRTAWRQTEERRLWWMIGSGMLMVVSILYSIPWAHELFPQFAYGANAMFRRSLLGIHLGLAITCLIALCIEGGIRCFACMRSDRGKRWQAL
jgi:predicted Abi (CAAX) family protease